MKSKFSEYPVWNAAVWTAADWTLLRTTVANVNLLWTVKSLYREELRKGMRKQCLVVSCLWLGVCAKVILIALRTMAPEHIQVFLSLSDSITAKLAYEKGKALLESLETNSF